MATTDDGEDDDLEQRALRLIIENDGLYQSELWKQLGESSRVGSRLADQLTAKGKITREEAVHNGQRTYFLTPADGSDSGSEGNRPPQPSLSENQQEALRLIEQHNGLLQSELWKQLEVSSRTGSRLAVSLAERGLIDRTETRQDGQKTYKLEPVTRTEELNWELLMAGDQISPLISEGDQPVDPTTSDEFTRWVMELTRTGAD